MSGRVGFDSFAFTAAPPPPIPLHVSRSVPSLRPAPPPPSLPHTESKFFSGPKEPNLEAILRASGEVRTKESRFKPGSLVAGRFRIHSKFSGVGKCPEMFFGVQIVSHGPGLKPVQKPVVIKVCAEAEEKKMQRLSREIEILKYLKSPDASRNIQTLVFDAHTGGQDALNYGRVLMMATEAKGDDLHTLVQKLGRFDIASTLYIADQIFDAFDYIHKKGIIHRDIKPSNIVAGRSEAKDFNVYMIDFDLAVNIYEQDAYGMTRHYEFEQKRGHRVGNPNYRTRNMHKGVRASRRDDVESMGLTLMRFVVGTLPWEKNDVGFNYLLTDEEKDERKSKLKEDFIHDIISRTGIGKDLDDVWLKFWVHVEELEYTQDPGIDWIRRLFHSFIAKEKIKIKPKKLLMFAKEPAPGSWGNLLRETRPNPYKGRPTIDQPTWGQVLRDKKKYEKPLPPKMEPPPQLSEMDASAEGPKAAAEEACPSRLNPNAAPFQPSVSNGRLPGVALSSLAMVRDDSGCLVPQSGDSPHPRPAERRRRQSGRRSPDAPAPVDVAEQVPVVQAVDEEVVAAAGEEAKDAALWQAYERAYGASGQGAAAWDVEDEELDFGGKVFMTEKKRLKWLAKKRKKAAKEAAVADESRYFGGKGMGRGIKAVRGATQLPGMGGFVPAPVLATPLPPTPSVALLSALQISSTTDE